MISPSDIKNAYARINSYIKKTPLTESSFFEEHLGHQIVFKLESLQVTGAFKIRGVLNTLLSLKEKGQLPEKIIAYSSGNHANAVAWAGHHFGIKAKIYMPSTATPLKLQTVRDLGAELVVTKSRIEAETGSKAEGLISGNYFLHPSDNDLVIAGAATLCYESLLGMEDALPEAIFGACGGGALISGTYLAANLFAKKISVYGCEPEIANDAAQSLKLGFITGFSESPDTIADGVRTLKVSERTFTYLKKLEAIIESSEDEIMYWTAWLNHILKINCEPTAALAMSGAFNWLKQQKSRKKILVLLSGGNSDQESLKKIWKTDHLKNVPELRLIKENKRII